MSEAKPHCPLCRRPLQKHDKYFACMQGHGALITPRHLREKDESVVSQIEAHANQAHNLTERTHLINCPHCNTTMDLVDYSHTGIMIDSCMHCHYRWLDAGELRRIKDHKPALSPSDTALLTQIEHDIESLQNRPFYIKHPFISVFIVMVCAACFLFYQSQVNRIEPTLQLFDEGLDVLRRE